MRNAMPFLFDEIHLYLVVFIVLSAIAPPAIAEYKVELITLDEEDPGRINFGQLIWRGGLKITSNDGRFGGLSALHVGPDGREFLAITDRGTWLRASLSYRDGHLADISNFRISSLLDPSGRPVSGRRADSESLAEIENGFIVSFERNHRLWLYAAGPGPAFKNPKSLPIPRGFGKLPDNGGIEAITRLCDGRLLAVAEKSVERRHGVAAWVRVGSLWKSLSYQTKAGLRPTGVATLPNCDIIFVERSFSFLAGLDIRISLVPADTIKPGAELKPIELASLSDPLNIDNFEGISARRSPSGDTLIYLVSDDNFSALQRTLLMMFQLKLPR